MYAINDALAQQIIRASVTGGPVAAGAYLHPSLHPAAAATGVPALPGGSPVAAIRRAAERLAARFAPLRPARPAQPACCAIA